LKNNISKLKGSSDTDLGFNTENRGGGYILLLKHKVKSLLTLVRNKYFGPKIMRRLKSEGTALPRKRNALPASKNTETLVYRLNATGSLISAASELESLLGSQYRRLIEDRSILIKYNLNTANPYPAAVDPQMLRTLTDLLLNLGAAVVSAGDCCTISLLPTRSQVKKAGLPEAMQGRAKLICFDDQTWVTVPIEGHFLKSVTVPRSALEAETIIALANLKTHCLAAYTGAIKLAVGFMHPLERKPLHRDHLQEKVAEINLALPSDLYIIDARTAMISGGPDFGKTAEADTILVGDNPLAVDLEAYNILYSLKEKNNCLDGFSGDPFSLTQLRHARDLGIGGKPWEGYRVKEWP
jgi:uncharacterized protein (DUF362 family)